MERVLILAGDAVEDLEVYYILYRLREQGYAITAHHAVGYTLDETPDRLGPAELAPHLTGTWRHVECPRLAVLSYENPVNANPSSGTPFHSLHATSQALQPMHSVVSVRKAVTGMGHAQSRYRVVLLLP